LVRGLREWSLFAGVDNNPTSRVSLDQDAAWKLFSKSLSPEAARQRVRIEGDRRLGEPMLGALAVMA
jgi:hypothetical protein